jgi:hypothetical protein
MSLFGKAYNVRPGGRTMMVKNNNLKHPKIGSLPVRDQNKSFGAVRRPGSIIQDPIPKIYDFDKMRKDDIFKFGTRVNLGQQLDFTYKESDGTVVTKKLSELSYDAGKKLEELKAISETGNNKGLEEKMELLNTLVGEISGKFNILTTDDMLNVGKILSNMGEKIVLPADVGIDTRYLTQKGYENLKKDADGYANLVLFLGNKIMVMKYLAKTTSETFIQTTKEFDDYFEEKGKKRIFDLNTITFMTYESWKKLGLMIQKPGRNGLIDYFEFDNHPTTAKNNAKILEEEKKVMEPFIRGVAEARKALNDVQEDTDDIRNVIDSYRKQIKDRDDKIIKLGVKEKDLTFGEITKKSSSKGLDSVRSKIMLMIKMNKEDKEGIVREKKLLIENLKAEKVMEIELENLGRSMERMI